MVAQLPRLGQVGTPENLVAAVDSQLVLRHASPRLGVLLARSYVVGGSLIELMPATEGVLKLALARLTPEVVLPTAPGCPPLLARTAVVGDQTWLLLFEGRRPLEQRLSNSAGFVGRNHELHAFKAHLVSDGASLLYVHGPLGIGKTALIAHFASYCGEVGCRVIELDARFVPPTEEALMRAITGGRSLKHFEAALEIGDRRWVLFIDNFDAWAVESQTQLVNGLCALLNAGSRIIVASRRIPDPKWWGSAFRRLHTMPLAVLPPGDAATLAETLGIAHRDIDDVVRRSAGHPLCIRTLSEASQAEGVSNLGGAPIEFELMTSWPREVLEIGVIPVRITEELLASFLDDAEASVIFDQLATLAFSDPSGIGLRLPGVLREVLVRRIRERSPQRYAELQHRLAVHTGVQLALGAGVPLVPLVDDFFDAVDDHPHLRSLAGARFDVRPATRRARPRDRTQLAELFASCFDDTVIGTMQTRFDQQVAVTCVAQGSRDIEAACQYFIVSASMLGRSTEGHDAELSVALEAISARLSLTPDEYAIAIVGWCGHDTAKGVWGPPSQALFRFVFPLLLSRPLPSAVVIVLPALFAFPTTNLPLVTSDGTYSVVYHELRGRHPSDVLTAILGWSALDAGRLQPMLGGEVDVHLSPELVREALSLLERPDRLTTSPLLALRSVESELGHDVSAPARAQALERVLRQTISRLGTSARDVKQREALEAVFLERAGKHEKIAADLNMTYSTFRRAITRGIERVTELLRLQEQTIRAANGHH